MSLKINKRFNKELFATHLLTYMLKIYDINEFELIKLFIDSNIYKEILYDNERYLEPMYKSIIDLTNELKEKYNIEFKSYVEWENMTIENAEIKFLT